MLKVAEQNGQLFLWYSFITDTGRTEEIDIDYFVAGTGIEFDNLDGFSYFDTVLMSDGLVWHVFL